MTSLAAMKQKQLKESEKKAKIELERYLVTIVQDNASSEKEINRQGRISPSSGCSYCSRQAFFTGIKPYFDYWGAASELYARVGVASENMVADSLRKTSYFLGQSIRLWENELLKLGAEFDIAILSPLTNQFTIVECKTCGDLPSKPKPYQEAQLQLYMAYYGCSGIMYYISRNVATFPAGDLLQKSIEIEFKPLDAKLAIMRAFVAKRAIEIGKIPPRNANIPDPTPSQKGFETAHSDCGFCTFAKFCWYGKDFHNYEHMSAIELAEIMSAGEEYCDNFFTLSELTKRREDLYEKLEVKPNKDDFLKSFVWNGGYIEEVYSI